MTSRSKRHDITIEEAAEVLGGGRRGAARARIALRHDESAITWAKAVASPQATDQEIHDLAGLIAWQGVKNDREAKARWVKRLGL
jgi:nanoRNase/pAp phosphatase (c-di-AMP/oligoRNAs hydrolase)